MAATGHQHGTSMEHTQPDKEIPAPIDRVAGVEIVFEDPTPDEAERHFLGNQRVFIVKACWPGFLEALVEFKPNTPFGVHFAADSQDAMAASMEKAKTHHWNLMTQPQAVVLSHPSKGNCHYEFHLNVFLEVHPSDSVDTVVLIAPNHRVVPVLSKEAYTTKNLLSAQSRDAALKAGEEIWATGRPGLLYALRSCYSQAETCQDAVREFLNRLVISPSAKHDQFVSLFMLIWCSDDEPLSKLGLELLAIQSKYGDFYEPEAKIAARQVGQKANDLGSLDAMRKLYNAVEWVVGTDAAYGLTFAWSRVGGWMA